MRASGPDERAVAIIDADAIAHNVRTLKAATSGELLAVVKANGYGHGAVGSARAALTGGADQLGVAYPTEALELRAAGITAPLLAWLWPPGEDITAAAGGAVMLGVSSPAHLDRVAAAPVSGAGIHLKIDTGLGRGGSPMSEWTRLCEAAAAAQRAREVDVVGVMSHLANSEVLGDPSIADQTARFRAALAVARDAGLTPRYAHLANTAAALGTPETRFDLVRCGIGIYGLDPLDTMTSGSGSRTGLRESHGLRPAMSLRATVALTKRVPAGQGVSYGLTYRTASESTLALIPIGYGDGISRTASGRAPVWVGGRQYTIAGRVAMDQLVIDVGDEAIMAGDEVILFGDGRLGEPTAADWAAACGTIDYEIVTAISARVPRRHVTGGVG